MTLLEMKKKVLRMIEEISPNNPNLTDDPDISYKINDVINQIQNELSRIKKIPDRTEIDVEKGDVKDFSEISTDLFQLNLVRNVKHQIIDSTIVFEESGTAQVYYYKYPTQITSETNNNYEFELSTDVLEIMPYGVAGDLLKSDISANYGRVYSERYEALKQNLDPRYHTGSIYVEEGEGYEFI